MDSQSSLEDRREAFSRRSSWFRTLGTGSYNDQRNYMVTHFDRMGVVEVFDGPTDVSDFPAKIQVEIRHPDLPVVEPQTLDIPIDIDPIANLNLEGESIDKINRFPRGL